MTDFSVSSLSNLIKETWIDERVQDYSFRKYDILKPLTRIKITPTGKNFSFGVKTYPSESSRYSSENPTMVATSNEELVKGYDSIYNLYTTRSLTKAVMADSKEGGALLDAAIYIPKDIMDRQSFHIARNAWSGVNGALAVCGTTTNSTTLQLATNSNMNRFYRGMIIDIRNSTTGAVCAGDGGGNSRTISSISAANEAAWQVVLDAAVTTTSANSVYIEDEAYADGGAIYSYNWHGLPELIGSGTVHNLAPGSYPEFVSYIQSSTGTLTLAKMQTNISKVEAKHEGTIKEIRVSPEVLQKYLAEFLPDMRWSPSDLGSIEAGTPTTVFYRGGSMGKIPVITDPLMPVDELYFIDWDALALPATVWLEWVDDDGSILHYVTRTLGYELVMLSRGNIIIKNRLGCSKMTGITV